MEKKQRRFFIITTIIIISFIVILGQYLGSFNVNEVLAVDPNPQHSWSQMECNTDLCVDSTNNRIGIGTISPSETLHVVGGFKVGDHTTYDVSTDEWNFTTPISVITPQDNSHAIRKDYIASAVQALGVSCGENFTDSRDNEEYSTIKVGNNCWMAENLRYLPSVSPPATGSNSDPHYYVYGYVGTNVQNAKDFIFHPTTDNIHIYKEFGVLYNFPATIREGDYRTCPEGWKIPNLYDWVNLTRAVCSSGKDTCNNTFGYDYIGGGSLGINEGTILKDGPFRVVLTGIRYGTSHIWRNLVGGFWTFPYDDNTVAWKYQLDAALTTISKSNYSDNKSFAYSIRCIKE
jgi:uncharacterized protein (TIGR02145 family)